MVLIQNDWYPYKKKLGHRHPEGRPLRTQGEGAHLQAKERGLGRNNPAHTLILDFQPPKLWGIKACCLSQCVCAILLCSPSWLVQVLRDWMWGSPVSMEWPGHRGPVSSPSNWGPGKPWRGQRGTIIFPLNKSSNDLCFHWSEGGQITEGQFLKRGRENFATGVYYKMQGWTDLS